MEVSFPHYSWLITVLQAALDEIMAVWTDPKYIRYTLYAQQFGTSASTIWPHLTNIQL